MKKIKFAVIGAALVLAGTLSFAQENVPVSMTNVATKGVFTTDVDNYMNENAWMEVAPEKIFAFTNFYANSLNLGFAKNFGSLYIGTYFSGNIPNIQTYEDVNDTRTLDESTSGWHRITGEHPVDLPSEFYNLRGEDTPHLGQKNNNLAFAALFGFGNIGLKASLVYKPQNYSIKIDYNDAAIDDIDYSWSHSEIVPIIDFGYTTEIAEKKLALHAGAAYAFAKSTTEETEGSITTVIKDAADTIGVYGDVSYEFAKNENISQTVKADVSYWGNLYPKETTILNGVTISEQNRSNGSIFITPTYKLTYSPTESVAIGLAAEIPMGIRFNKWGTAKDSSFDMGANIATAVQYTIKPELAVFNLGGKIALPQIIHTEKDSNSKSSSFFGGCSMDLSTGLTFYLTKNVVLDTSFDIIKSKTIINAVGNYEYVQGTSFDDIWTTALGFQLSIKY